MHGWNTFGARMSCRHTWTHKIHKIHHNPNLRKATTFPFIIFSMISHGGCTQISFCPETPRLKVSKFPKLGLPALWRAIASCVDLQLRWGPKQSCSPHQELFNNMWHATWTHVFQGKFWLLVGGSQIGLWLLALLLAITCVLSIQISHASPF
jgi:hypothetical protein